MRIVVATLALVLTGCGSRAPDATEPAAAESSVPASPAASGPRHARATRGDTVVEIDDRPGFLIDGNAPPPPPGSPVAPDPALSGNCRGDLLGCSESGTVVRRARSFEEAVEGLRGLGFDVEVR
jgi:hypothetical protein